MYSSNKTFLPSEKYENRKWFLIDCKNKKLGRLATVVVSILKGNKKPQYYSYLSQTLDIGDYVILINANEIISDNKNQKLVVHKPGRPGRSLKKDSSTSNRSKFAIERTIKGMLSNTQARKFMKRLNIYNGDKHPHKAQGPIKLDASRF